MKFISESKRYKKLLKKKRLKVKSELINKLSVLETSKEFWRIIEQLKENDSNPADNITVNEWKEHFEALYTTPIIDSCLELEITRLESVPHCNTQLNKPFTISEVKKSLKKLTNNKATSCDLVLNEMLKYGAPIVVPAVCKLFNAVLDSGIFPEVWNITYQVPVFKAGNPADCNTIVELQLVVVLEKSTRIYCRPVFWRMSRKTEK